MKTTTLLILAISTSLASGCIITTDDDATITIANESSFIFDSIELARTFVDEPYGPNELGGIPLLPGDQITLGVDCDTYDILIEDDTAATCELLGLDLCLNDALWIVDDIELNICIFARQPEGPTFPAFVEPAERFVDLRQ